MVASTCIGCARIFEITDKAVLLDKDPFCSTQCLIDCITRGWLHNWKPEPGRKPQ